MPCAAFTLQECGTYLHAISGRSKVFSRLVCIFVFFCFSVWGSLPCYLLQVGAKICHVLHFEAEISHLHGFCSILELKQVIWINLDSQHV
jgi:hypothetical protein